MKLKSTNVEIVEYRTGTKEEKSKMIEPRYVYMERRKKKKVENDELGK